MESSNNAIRAPSSLIPFLKWPGGKRWIKPHAHKLLPETFNRYIEPFLGGGALFFQMRPKEAHLSDVNAELINTYLCIQEKWERVHSILRRHHERHSKAYYYKIRNCEYKDRFHLAARTLYLNRTCWNGLYRVNLKGEFNVPIGTKTAVILPTDDFEQTAQALSNATIRCSDFEKQIDSAQENDLVFVDPPYTVKHNLNGFIKYNENLFSWEDQIRLRDAVRRAANRGAFVLVANANHSSVRDLYSGLGSTETLKRASVLSGDAKFRTDTDELFVRTWLPS